MPRNNSYNLNHNIKCEYNHYDKDNINKGKFSSVILSFIKK